MKVTLLLHEKVRTAYFFVLELRTQMGHHSPCIYRIRWA